MPNNVKVVITGQNDSRGAFNQLDASLKESAASANAMQEQFANLGHVLEAFIGAEVISKLSEIVKGAMETDVAIAHLSQKVGMSTEFLSGFSYVARLADVSVEDLGVGFRKFSQAIEGALQGSPKLVGAFHALGIEEKDLKALSPQELLMKVADALHGTADGAAKAAIMMALFGRSGTNLIPVFNQGAGAIDTLRDKADRLGGVMSGSASESAEALHKNLVDLKTVGMGLANQLLEGLKPAIDAVADSLDNANVKGVGFWKTLGMKGGELLVGLPMDVRRRFLEGQIGFNAKASESDPYIRAQVDEWREKLAVLEREQARYREAISGIRGGASVAQPLASHQVGNPFGVIASHGPDAYKKPLQYGLGDGTDSGGGSNVHGHIAHDSMAAEAKRLEDAIARAREAGAEAQISIAKGLEKAQIAQLDLEREQGLLTLSDYFSKRGALQETASEEEISQLVEKENALIAKRAAMPAGPGPERLAVDAEIGKAQAAIFAAYYGMGEQQSKNATEELKRQHELRDFILASENEIRSAKGQTLQVAIEAIQKEYDEKKRKLLEENRKKGGSAEDPRIQQDARGLDMVAQQKIAQVTAQNVAEQIDVIYASLDLNLERLGNQVARYAISAMDAEKQANAKRAEAATAIQKLTTEYGKLAQAAGDPKMMAETDKMAVKLDALRQHADRLKTALGEGLTQGLDAFFADLRNGAGPAKDFEDFAMSIVGSIEKMIEQMLIMQMVQKAMGMMFPGAGSSSSNAADISMADGSTISNQASASWGGGGLPMLAGGGDLAANQPAIVGEAGPELWVPRSAGQVVPNSALQGSGGAGGKGGGSVSMQVTVVNNGSPKNAQATQPQWNEQMKSWHMQLHMDDALGNGPLSRSLTGSR
jgi:hypothetical protein